MSSIVGHGGAEVIPRSAMHLPGATIVRLIMNEYSSAGRAKRVRAKIELATS